ncbi:flagellar FlbD family protein [Mesobacillus subterraneus]|uniref:flagellar FlbD family protein n=1 Tax=Mesobacillus subterraneus TaxID=285983 RepID=UPI00203FF987|nr:flagellar FlbD family protein [Mesobacillus subterraneus]MCM3684369.1 flagellar FlbD family protein [Mesobacillus subterraneus]
MIQVTKLNGKTFRINSLFIETVESFPDTTIALTNGRKYVVRESVDEVSKLIQEFYQSVGLLGGRMLEEQNNEE